jgi:hypothetical protein
MLYLNKVGYKQILKKQTIFLPFIRTQNVQNNIIFMMNSV